MNNNFLRNLKNIRKERGMTQEDLAMLLGVTKQIIFTYENGTSLPSIDILENMCDILNVAEDELLGFSNQHYLEELQKVIQEKVKITAEAEAVEYGLKAMQYKYDETTTKAMFNEKEEELKQKLINDMSLDKMSVYELSEIHEYIYKKKLHKILSAIEKDERYNYRDLIIAEFEMEAREKFSRK